MNRQIMFKLLLAIKQPKYHIISSFLLFQNITKMKHLYGFSKKLFDFRQNLIATSSAAN